MKTWAKALIILAVIASGTISLLLAPLVPTSLSGTKEVPYDGSVTNIDFIANVEAANIFIQYAPSNTSDLINVQWDFTVRHSVLVPPPTIDVNLNNYTSINHLVAELTIQISGMQFASGLLCTVIVTINPLLISNFSVTTTEGIIHLNTTNFQKLQFLDVNLTSLTTGSIYTSFIDGCDIQGDLRLETDTGYCLGYLETNSDIDGILSAITTTGTINVTLSANISLTQNFIIQATTGQIFFTIENCTIAGGEIIGILETSTGNIRAILDQRVDSNGNLTLDVDSDSGTIRLIIDLDSAGSIQSSVTPSTTTGTVTGSLSNYTYSSGTYFSDFGAQPYKMDATLDTSSGNIVLAGGYS